MRLLITQCCILACCFASAQDYKKIPFWNSGLSFDERAADIVSRLTLEEKVAQMLNSAPAISRFGIPAYDWWNEVLHGVARTPFRVTSYPQAIGMAATWDQESMLFMGHYSALEGRAIHNKATELGRNNERYLGLTYWTPNINIFRDPRWGRGQETYGEDPFLTARIAHAFVKGLQGDDPKYLKAAACAKHFAVHSGPEPSRHSDDYVTSDYDLWDTYLPAFRELVTRANVAGVMCAYNAYRGQPCCASNLLMKEILRKKWNFTGYITSDCWALDDFFRFHKTHPDAVSSAVDALFHTTDVECGNSVYSKLTEAAEKGLVPESLIDESLKRLFIIRLRLGMFDPPSMVKYANTPFSILESPEHGTHALKMAQQSIVLLKNENNTLPLSKNIRKIAVLGPNANNSISVLGNYNGVPSKIVTVLEGIKQKLGGNVEVLYEKAVNFTHDTLIDNSYLPGSFSWEGQPGFRAEYFNNRELSGNPEVVRREQAIDFEWLEGQNIVENIRAMNFSARFTAEFKASKSEEITIEMEADDGYRLIIDGKELINAWQRNRWGARVLKLDVEKDRVYRFQVEYWQGEGNARVRMRAGRFVKADLKQIANRFADADAIVFVGGISPQLEGEEMDVNAVGFKGGDRKSIMLPEVQTRLLKELKAIGKPVVFVMMTGSAIAIPWEDENIPAILNAWYGGQSAGTAVADVLFGDYNPAGRLPVTFYRSDADLPDFKDYNMDNRTYRYYKGEVLYPFGYGLSYSTFRYGKVKMPKKIKTGVPLNLTATITNTGKMDGEEVVQLYISWPDVKAKKPIRALKAFQRISLKAGESRTVRFTLTPEELSLVDENGNLYQPKSRAEISIGGGQPAVGRKTSSDVVFGRLWVR
jgi:beta-glucosidase